MTRHKTYVPVTPGTFPEEPEANALKVEVFYSKGGLNYFNYKDEARGYYASIRPVTVEHGPVFASERFMMFATNPMAGKLLLAKATRLNRKTLDAFADKVLAAAPELATLVLAGNKAALLDKIREAAGVAPAVAA